MKLRHWCHYRLGPFYHVVLPSCRLWIIHRLNISSHCGCTIFVFFFLFADMDVNNQKCLKPHGLSSLCCIFDGPRYSVRHGWNIFEWHFISAILLILMRFLSFIGVCVCLRQCMWGAVVAAIKWKKSLYQTMFVTAQRRRDLCWPWTAD